MKYENFDVATKIVRQINKNEGLIKRLKSADVSIVITSEDSTICESQPRVLKCTGFDYLCDSLINEYLKQLIKQNEELKERLETL